MNSNKYSYNMNPLLERKTDKGKRKFKSGHDSTDGSGGHTLDRNLLPTLQVPGNKTFLEEPTFSDDPSDWNMADYKYNIHFLKKYMINQKRYLEHETETFARNNELLVSIKSDKKFNDDQCIRKKSEIQKLKNGIEDYKSQIRRQSDVISSHRSQLICEEEVNRDLKIQKRRLTKRMEMQLRKQAEEGITDDVIEAYESAKEQLEYEQERKERLVKKDNWYTTEIATMREVLAQEGNNNTPNGIEIEKVSLDEEQDACSSNNNTARLFPKVNIRTCAISAEPFDKSAGPFQDSHKQKQRANECECVSPLPSVSNAQPNVLCHHQSVVTKRDNDPCLPKIEVKDRYVPNLSKNEKKDVNVPNAHAALAMTTYVLHPPKDEGTHANVPYQQRDKDVHAHDKHPPTNQNTHTFVPHPLRDIPCQTTHVSTPRYGPRPSAPASHHGHILRSQIVSPRCENVPPLPEVDCIKDHVPRPPSGKKNGAIRRFYRKLKNVIK